MPHGRLGRWPRACSHGGHAARWNVWSGGTGAAERVAHSGVSQRGVGWGWRGGVRLSLEGLAAYPRESSVSRRFLKTPTAQSEGNCRKGQCGRRFPNRDRPGSPYRAVALPHRAPFPRNARLPLSVREPGPAPDNPAPPPPLTEFATASEKRPERDSVRRDDSRSPHRDTAHEEPSHPARAPSRQNPDEQQGRACALFAWRGDRYARRG
ncbi:unnamed protein product [Lampetra fluviatilis]